MAGHDLESADDWFGHYKVLKPEFPCMLCGIRNSHGVNPGKDPSTMDGCFMWFETKHSQPTLYSKLVQETKPYGSWVSANRCRWKFVNWKDSKPPVPVQMWPYSVLGVKRCFGNGICTSTFPKTTHISWWPLLFSHVSQCTHIKEIMSRVSSRIRKKRWLPSVPRMTRTHTTVSIYIAHFNIDTHNKNEVACIQESIYTSISAHIYVCWKCENPII